MKVERRHSLIKDKLAQSFIAKHKLSPRNGQKSPEHEKMMLTLSHKFDEFMHAKKFDSRALGQLEGKLLAMPEVQTRVFSQGAPRNSSKSPMNARTE